MPKGCGSMAAAWSKYSEFPVQNELKISRKRAQNQQKMSKTAGQSLAKGSADEPPLLLHISGQVVR
jgi:hypothetical protein